jgi:predicted HicB family RNase H-like nuclease
MASRLLFYHSGGSSREVFFNVRVGSQLHRQAALFAQERGLNLNKLVTDALEFYLKAQSLENI